MAFIPDAPLKFKPDVPPPAPDPIATANTAANAQEHGPMQDVIDMVKAVPHGLLPALWGQIQGMTNPIGNVVHAARAVGGAMQHPHETLTSVGDTLRNATPQQVGANVVAPLVVGGALKGAGGLAADAEGATSAAAAEAASPAGQLGLRTTGPRPVATTAAGPTAGPTMDLQNQMVSRKILGADAGVPHSEPVNHTTLKDAATKPGQMLDQAADLVPTSPLSPEAVNKVQAARGPKTITPGSPDVDNYVNATEARLTDPTAQFSGPEIRATRNLLTGEAAAGRNSTDPAQRALAKYKQSVVDALDQHVADTLPEGSPISPAMVHNARATLAKNYNLRDLIGKGGDIDLQALAADHRANPNKYTGPTRTVAQFASDHPEVSGNISDATRIAPPSLAGDVSHINILNPRTWVQPLVGAAGRRGLRGPAGDARFAAERTPVAGLGGEFDPLPLNDLTPPPGQAFTPHQPDLAAGTETPRPTRTPRELQGMAAEPQQLSLDAPRTYGGQPANNSDLGAVMSQGVPEDIMARTSPRFSANNASGQTAVSQEFANAQSADKAANRTRSIISPDGNAIPVHGVAARDIGVQGSTAGATVPRGHIAIEEQPGEAPRIIDRGGLPHSVAQGLLNRYLANQLGSGF